MFFKIGKTLSQGKTYVIFESNYTGYIVYVPNPKDFTINKSIKLFTYIYKSEFQETMYGFKSFDERVMFENLLSISGVGPKSAIQLLATGFENLVKCIQQNDIEKLKQVPYIGERTAAMIVFELKHKYKLKSEENLHLPSEIKTTLKTLGFKKDQIDYAMSKLSPNDNLEELIEGAIKLIANEKQFKTTTV